MSLDIQAVVVPLERSTTREAEQAGGVVIVKRRYQPAPVAVEPDVKRMTTAPAGHEHISFAPKHRYTSVAPSWPCYLCTCKAIYCSHNSTEGYAAVAECVAETP